MQCVFSASEKPFARKAGGLVTRPSLPSPSLPMDTSTSARRPSYNPGAGSHTSVQPETPHEGYGDGDEEEEDQDQAGPSQGDIGNILYNSSLNNPADALRMLATASTLNSPHPTGGGAGPHPRMPSRNNSDQPDLNLESGWTAWSPIVMGILSQEEAQQLFSLCVSFQVPRSSTDRPPRSQLPAPDAAPLPSSSRRDLPSPTARITHVDRVPPSRHDGQHRRAVRRLDPRRRAAGDDPRPARRLATARNCLHLRRKSRSAPPQQRRESPAARRVADDGHAPPVPRWRPAPGPPGHPVHPQLFDPVRLVIVELYR